MKKHIDAEKLIAEIEKLSAKAKNDKEKAFAKKDAAGHLAAIEKTIAYVKIKKLINSLQQEQPEFPTTDEEVETTLASTPKVELPDKYKTPDWLFKQQEQQESSKGKFVFPKYLYARTKDNKTIDISYAPQDMTAVEYVRINFVEHEPEVDLEKELRNWMVEMDGKYALLATDYVDRLITDTAKHFYELGLKAK